MVSVLSRAGPEVTGITSGPAIAEVVAVLGLVETKPGLWPRQGVSPRHPISGSLYLWASHGTCALSCCLNVLLQWRNPASPLFSFELFLCTSGPACCLI